jgi:hypothetical protein
MAPWKGALLGAGIVVASLALMVGAAAAAYAALSAFGPEAFIAGAALLLVAAGAIAGCSTLGSRQ